MALALFEPLGTSLCFKRVLPDFRMIVLERFGHSPWRERFAADAF